MASKWCDSWRAVAVLGLGLAGLYSWSPLAGAPINKAGVSAQSAPVSEIAVISPRGEIVLMLYDKIYGLAKRLVDFEEFLLFRLKKKRPIDETRAQASLYSGKKQMKRLYQKALRLQARLPAGDPALAEVELAKLRISGLKPEHMSNSAAIAKILGDKSPLAASVATAAEYFDPPPLVATESYPVKDLDGQF